MPQKAPKCPQNALHCPKMPRNAPKYLKISQNAPKYVLQDYRGVGWRAPLPTKPKGLAGGHWYLPVLVLQNPNQLILAVLFGLFALDEGLFALLLGVCVGINNEKK